MNVGEANDVNTVLRFFLDVPADRPPDADRALEAARRLAMDAHRALGVVVRDADFGAAARRGDVLRRLGLEPPRPTPAEGGES